MKKRFGKLDILYGIALLLMTVGFTGLAYRQTIKYNGKYLSDVFYYTKLGDDSTINRAISVIFKALKSPDGGTMGIAIFMGLVITGVIVATFFLIKYLINSSPIIKNKKFLSSNNTNSYLLNEKNQWMAQLGSIIALFTTAIYVPVFYEHFYMRTFSKWAWHNPTQQLMVFASIISLISFFKVYENYTEKIDVKYWIIFLISTFVSAWAKPSYVFVFAPTLIIFLIIDLFSKSEHSFLYKFGRCVLMGLPVLPAGIYLLYMNFMEFNNSDATGNTSKIMIDFGYFLKKSSHPIVMILLSTLFPLIVYIFNRKILKDRKHKIILTMFVLGVLEYVTLIESGPKAKYGNFGWSRSVTLFIVFTSAIALFISNILDTNFMHEKRQLKNWYFAGAGFALLLHLLSGVVYFCIVLTGRSYEI